MMDDPIQIMQALDKVRAVTNRQTAALTVAETALKCLGELETGMQQPGISMLACLSTSTRQMRLHSGISDGLSPSAERKRIVVEIIELMKEYQRLEMAAGYDEIISYAKVMANE